ncbi:MAG: zinc metallopeptidase [Planctomycetota bacterium]|jgi:Zn-dependent membrane protease YugP|nr:zinc metallopeptidase [Planctomycetota bacterium]
MGDLGGMGGSLGFMGMDRLYMVVFGVTMALSLIAQWWIKASFNKYSRMGNSRNMSGAEAAAEMLRDEGIADVQVRRFEGGMLSDHYDPRTKVINLSPGVYDGRSIAAVGVACHEAGHALQHARGYAALVFRNILVGPTTLASKFGIPLIMIGLVFQSLGLAKLGLVLFSVTFLFQLITLPVEINASVRSRNSLVAHRIVAPGAEARGVSTVLTAAAFTYIAAAIASLMTLLYWAYRLGLLGGGRRNE